MKKVFIQGFLIMFIFFGSWFALAQIDWSNVFKVEEVNNNTEEKVGELFWEYVKKSEKELTNKLVINSIDSIVTHICISNKIERTKLKIHVINKSEINAFALPDGHLIINSGLISNSDNQEELAGVICHEIAHIELNHVIKKLIKEIGLSVLISMSTNNSGTEVVKEAAKMLSSTAFDRGIEKEADIKAINYLVNANVNPKALAEFFYKMAENENEKYVSWISTHPDLKERAAYINEYSEGKLIDYKQILSNETWEKLKNEIIK